MHVSCFDGDFHLLCDRDSEFELKAQVDTLGTTPLDPRFSSSLEPYTCDIYVARQVFDYFDKVLCREDEVFDENSIAKSFDKNLKSFKSSPLLSPQRPIPIILMTHEMCRINQK